MKSSKTVISSSKAIMGIDIGTTNIGAVLIDIENNKILNTSTVANNAKLPADSDLSEYDAERIWEQVKKILNHLTKAYPNVVSIGLTGQMHGVLYVNEEGRAISPFYNWQDGRGNRKINPDRTYCEEIKYRTGHTVFSGYGFATLFHNRINHLEPQGAKTFCTIMDYIGMNLTGNTSPVIHATNAASIGLYDIQKQCFDARAIEKLGLADLILPKIAKEGTVIGYYEDIPVSVAIGDNQASFLGSVKKEGTSALVNFGTGSQVSVIADNWRAVEGNLEIRPYLFGKYLICGSALCGGKAYSLLEKFFSEYAEAITGDARTQYELMNDLALKAYSEKQSLKVSTQFCGTRKEPDLRGSISGIDDTNFTPGNLVIGVLQGMAEELKRYFDCMQADNITELVASGNAIQKNPVLRLVLKDTFNLEVNLTNGHEEAATGAALYAGLSSGVIRSQQAADIITYRKD